MQFEVVNRAEYEYMEVNFGRVDNNQLEAVKQDLQMLYNHLHPFGHEILWIETTGKKNTILTANLKVIDQLKVF